MIGKIIGLKDGMVRNVELRIANDRLFSAIAKPAGEIDPGTITAYRVDRRRRWLREYFHLILERAGSQPEVDFYRTSQDFDMTALLTELINTVGERIRKGTDLFPPPQMPVFQAFQIDDLPELVFAGDSTEGWTARLPDTAPTFYAKPIAIHLSATVETGLPWQGNIPWLRAILSELPAIVSRAEAAFAEHSGDGLADDLKSVKNPQIRFSDDGEEGEWGLVIHRENWEDFVWWIRFRGSEVQDVLAGD